MMRPDNHSVLRLARITTIVCAVFLCLAFMALASAPACAKTIHVPGDYGTIQDAVNVAAKGDTITVNSGTYAENVVVGRAVTIIGQDTGNGMPTVDGRGKHGFTITVGSVTLQGFKIVNCDDGIKIDPSIQNSMSKINLIGNMLTNNDYGIAGHGYINVVNNNASYNKNEGIYVMDTDSNVTGNTAIGNGGRGFFLDSEEIYVAGNTAINNDNDGFFIQSDNNVVTGNVARNNYYGINILEGSNNIVRGNMASNNNWAGIFINIDSYGNEITGNTADNNRYVGICFDKQKALNNTVTGNSVYNNSYAGLAFFDALSRDIVTYDTPEETFKHLFSYDFSTSNNIVKDNNVDSPGPIIVPSSRGTGSPASAGKAGTGTISPSPGTSSPQGNPTRQAAASATQNAGPGLPGYSSVVALLLAGIVMIGAKHRRKNDR